MNPWYSAFIPTVTKKVTNTNELTSALTAANPGDMIELAAGVYTAAPAFMLTRSGTPEKPIVIRAAKGAHAEIKGGFAVRAKDNWLQDLDIHHWDGYAKDPFNQPVNGVNTVVGMAAGLRIINCILREGFRGNAVAVWRRNPRAVMYGNIIYGLTTDTGQPHHSYMQNDMDNLSGEGGEAGWQYLIRNLCLDSSETARISFTLRGYGTNAPVSGFHVEGNVSRNGRSLYGCENQYPAYKIKYLKNYFCDSRPELGYHCPGHAAVEDNIIILLGDGDNGAATTYLNCQWGANEQRYQALQATLAPFSFQRNKIYRPPGLTPKAIYGARTARFPTPTNEPVFAETSLMPTDIIDHNELHGDFWFKLEATKGGTVGNIEGWRALTESAGCKYDGNSTLDLLMPTKNHVSILDNEYDPNRAYLVVINWEKAVNQNVVLPKKGKVYKAKDSWGLDIAAGATVAVPLDPEHMMDVFVIKFDEPVEPEPPPVPDKVDLTEEITLAESISKNQDEAATKLIPIKGYQGADAKLKKACDDQKILIQKLKDKNK